MVTLIKIEDVELTELRFEEEIEENVLNPPQPRTLRILRFYVMFLFMWQTLFRVSDAGMSAPFVYLAMLLALVLSNVENPDVQAFIQMFGKKLFGSQETIWNSS